MKTVNCDFQSLCGYTPPPPSSAWSVLRLCVCPSPQLSLVNLTLPSASFATESERKSHSHVQLYATPWTVAHQTPPSLGFSRQEQWIGLPLPSPGALPHPKMEPGSPALQTDSFPAVYSHHSPAGFARQDLHHHFLEEETEALRDLPKARCLFQREIWDP